MTEAGTSRGTANTEGGELVIVRTFDAPRHLMFQVWTKPEHLLKWWGPKGLTMGIAKLDLRPAGLFHYSMKTPDGHEMWGKFVYHEIAAPEKLVFVNAFSDMDGNTLRNPMSPGWPLEIINTLTFAENEGKTMLTMKASPLNAAEEERQTFAASHDMVKTGFAGTWSQLEAYLQEIQ